MAFTALLDANVLYPAPLRDLLLQLTTAKVFRARWTSAIQKESMASAATATDPKQCTAACSAARAEAENNQRIGHSPVPAELDNSPGS